MGTYLQVLGIPLNVVPERFNGGGKMNFGDRGDSGGGGNVGNGGMGAPFHELGVGCIKRERWGLSSTCLQEQ